MKRIISLLICFVIIIGLLSGCESAKQSAFMVGYAQGDITPTDSLPLTGMADDDTRFSTGILDPLYATCVTFTDTEGNTVIMFCLDLLNTNEAVCNTARTMISNETGVPRSNIMFTASHTHSGPTQKKATQYPAVEKSNGKIVNVCLQLAKDALADRKPAQMFTTFTHPEKLNFVRHYLLADGSYMGRRLGYINKSQFIGNMHKADNLLQLVKFTREGGKDVILTNWQAHYHGATSIDYNAFSADYPGAYRKYLEQSLDCHAAFVLGGAGNLTSSSRIDRDNRTTDYNDHGRALAEYAVEAAANFKPANVGKIYVMENTFRTETSATPIPLYAFGFGDFGCAFAPFEIFDTNARGVREDSHWKYTFYASCANGGDSNMYLPDHEGFSFPTYEAYGSKEEPVKYTRFPEGTAEAIQAELTRMLNDLFAQSGNEKQEKDDGYKWEPVEPASDGLEYTNPAPGDLSKIKEGQNGYYCFTLIEGNNLRNMVAVDKATAEAVIQKSSMKLIFDERGAIVGVVE